MAVIITVQHTEAEHHLLHRIGGGHEWPLTEAGRAQAFRIGEWLRGEGCDGGWRMYVSPQLRATQTAEEISRALGCAPVIRGALKECDAGRGNGEPWAWYCANRAPCGPGYDPDYRPFPDAESDRDVWDRLFPIYRELAACRWEGVLVVSHGTALSFLHSMLLGHALENRAAFRCAGRSGAVSRFEASPDGRVTARYINQSVFGRTDD